MSCVGLALQAMLDILLPVACLVALYRLIEWSGERARLAIQSRLEGDSDMGVQLRRRSTVAALVLLALRNPAAFVLPPLCFAYVFRTALNIVDLVVNKYKPAMPEVAGFMIKQVSKSAAPATVKMDWVKPHEGMPIAICTGLAPDHALYAALYMPAGLNLRCSTSSPYHRTADSQDSTWQHCKQRLPAGGSCTPTSTTAVWFSTAGWVAATTIITCHLTMLGACPARCLLSWCPWTLLSRPCSR